MQLEVRTHGHRLTGIDRSRLDVALGHLDRLTDHYGVRRLRVTVERVGHGEDVQVRMVLVLTRRRLVAAERDVAVGPAAQRCVEVLSRKIELAKARVHRGHGERAVRRAKAEAALVDLDALRDARREGDYEKFRDALAEVPDAVRAEVGRRLRFHPDAEALLDAAFSISDVVERVLRHAFDAFEARPASVPLRSWLFAAVDPVLDALVREVLSVGEEAPREGASEAA